MARSTTGWRATPAPRSTATARWRGPGGSIGAVLDRLLAHAYFARPAPKSLDRLDFAAALAASGLDGLSPADGAATLVAFTAGRVAAAPLPAPPLRWLVTGGGRHNPAIMAALRDRLGVPVEPVEALAGTATRWRRSASASSPCARGGAADQLSRDDGRAAADVRRPDHRAGRRAAASAGAEATSPPPWSCR